MDRNAAQIPGFTQSLWNHNDTRSEREWSNSYCNKLCSNTSEVVGSESPAAGICTISLSRAKQPWAKKYSVWAEWLHLSGRPPSKPTETPLWWITPRPVSIHRVALHDALRSQLNSLFVFCRSPILNDHSGVVTSCNHRTDWLHWVHGCIGIAMRWVTLWKSLLVSLVPARKMQFSLYQLYTSFQVPWSIWPLTILRSFRPSAVLLLVAICRIPCTQLTIFPTLKTCQVRLPVLFSLVPISGQETSYQSIQVVWWAPG